MIRQEQHINGNLGRPQVTELCLHHRSTESVTGWHYWLTSIHIVRLFHQRRCCKSRCLDSKRAIARAMGTSTCCDARVGKGFQRQSKAHSVCVSFQTNLTALASGVYMCSICVVTRHVYPFRWMSEVLETPNARCVTSASHRTSFGANARLKVISYDAQSIANAPLFQPRGRPQHLLGFWEQISQAIATDSMKLERHLERSGTLFPHNHARNSPQRAQMK